MVQHNLDENLDVCTIPSFLNFLKCHNKYYRNLVNDVS